MIEVSLTYGQLVWLLVIYLVGEFVGGFVKAAVDDLWASRKKRREEVAD